MRSSVVGNDAGLASVQHIISLRALSRNSISKIEKKLNKGKETIFKTSNRELKS